MTPKPGGPRNEGESEGWEAFEEAISEGTLAPNSEVEESMEQAADAVGAEKAESRSRQESERGAEAENGARSNISAGESADSAAPALESEPSRTRAELEQTRDQLLRLRADFENFRRRAQRERDEAYQFGHENLARDLLPILDDFERALEHARRPEGPDVSALAEGVELVLREILAIFSKHGVDEIQALGKGFDPAVHEALAQTEASGVEPNTIVQVAQKGYQLRERLLRPARVIIAKAAGGCGASSNGSDSEPSDA